jgi:hypothetical protein
MQWQFDKLGSGFPGWHLECSAMSRKYLGKHFDIHGGGIDLLFPHHECEIAQSTAAFGEAPVNYWMHNNLITLNGKKMGKSLSNAISLDELFSGKHNLLEKPYHPMTIRFFILQAHYRSTLDFSNEALQAAEKGLEKLFSGIHILDKIQPLSNSTIDIKFLEKRCHDALNNDLDTPILISCLFDGIRMINSIQIKQESINKEDLETLKRLYQTFAVDILGLQSEEISIGKDKFSNELIDTILNIRMKAKYNLDFETADSIRNALNNLGIEIKDIKNGFDWEIILKDKSKPEEQIFFESLLEETNKVYQNSPIKKRQDKLEKNWNYAICDTPIQKNTGIIFGLNWGGDNHKPQSEYPVKEKNRNWIFIKNSLSYIKKHLNIDSISEINYTNLCFFRTPKINYLIDEDWEKSMPLFKKYVEYINPPWTLLLGTTGIEKLKRYCQITNLDCIEIKSEGKRTFGYIGKLFDKYPLYCVPHPQNKIPTEIRSAVWDKVMIHFNK